MAHRTQPPQISLTPIPHQWHRPGHAPERTRRDRGPGVDSDPYLRPVPREPVYTPERTQRHRAPGVDSDPYLRPVPRGPGYTPERTQRHRAPGVDSDPYLRPVPRGPGYTPERTQRHRAPGVDDDDLYLRPSAGQKKKGLESASRDGGYQTYIARDVSDREHYKSPSHGHSEHTYRSLQPGTVQDQVSFTFTFVCVYGGEGGKGGIYVM